MTYPEIKELAKLIKKELQKDNPILLFDNTDINTIYNALMAYGNPPEKKTGSMYILKLLERIDKLSNNANGKKDNPVPSLENKYLQQLKTDVGSIQTNNMDDLQIIEAVIILIEKLQNGVENANVKTNYVELVVSGKLRGVYSSERMAELDCKNSDIKTYSIFPLGTTIFTDD